MDSNEKQCRHCGKVFVRPKSGAYYSGFCSGRCMGRFYRERRRLNPPTPPESKVCALCGESKAADQFPKSINSADGLHRHCLECARSMSRATYPQRRERRLEHHRQRQASDPEYRESARKRAREYYYDHYDESLQKHAQAYRNLTDEQRERRRQVYRRSYERKRARVDALKEGKACIRCGESHPASLEFHHRDPSTKLFNIADGVVSGGWTDEQIREEVAKTTILCANCHKIMHWEETHGGG